MDFVTIIFNGATWSGQPSVDLPTWRARSLYLCLPSDSVVLLYPQAPGSLFVALYDTQDLIFSENNQNLDH
jgi:hypothetical protein